MLHPLTFDIDLHVFSFMIPACNTIFGEGPPDLQHNAATSNNIHEQPFYKMQTLQFSFGEWCVVCVCWPSWILSTGHWWQSTRHLNRGVGTFNLDPPPTLPSPSMLQNPSKDSQLLCYCSLTTKQCLEYLSKTPALFCNHTAAICESYPQLNEYIYLQNQKVILKEEVVREAKYVLWSAFRAFSKEEGISEAWRGNVGWLGISWDYPSQLTQLTRAQVQFNAKPRNTRQRNEVYPCFWCNY